MNDWIDEGPRTRDVLHDCAASDVILLYDRSNLDRQFAFVKPNIQLNKNTNEKEMKSSRFLAMRSRTVWLQILAKNDENIIQIANKPAEDIDIVVQGWKNSIRKIMNSGWVTVNNF